MNAVNTAGATPIHLAAMLGHTLAVRVLVAGQANLTLRDGAGFSVRHYAEKNGMWELARSVHIYRVVLLVLDCPVPATDRIVMPFVSREPVLTAI